MTFCMWQLTFVFFFLLGGLLRNNITFKSTYTCIYIKSANIENKAVDICNKIVHEKNYKNQSVDFIIMEKAKNYEISFPPKFLYVPYFTISCTSVPICFWEGRILFIFVKTYALCNLLKVYTMALAQTGVLTLWKSAFFNKHLFLILSPVS